MSDPVLSRAFEVFSPSPGQVARVDAAVRARLASRKRTIAGEWWALLRARPLVNGAWMAVGAAVLLATTPLAAAPALWKRLGAAPPVAIESAGAPATVESPSAAPEKAAPAAG